jgi:hypothetical protein
LLVLLKRDSSDDLHRDAVVEAAVTFRRADAEQRES